MYLGQPFKFQAVAYKARRRPKKNQWTHWSIEAKREGNSECARQSIGITICSVRESRKGFVKTGDFSVSFNVYLGNVNYPKERCRIRTPNCLDETPISQELESIATKTGEYLWGLKKIQDSIREIDLRRIVYDVCIVEVSRRQTA